VCIETGELEKHHLLLLIMDAAKTSRNGAAHPFWNSRKMGCGEIASVFLTTISDAGICA
jgi:hypothetical protein